MGNLTGCLKKSSLTSGDKAEIRELARDYRNDEGLSAKAAGLTAVNDSISEVEAERGKAVSYIEKQGGTAPDQPKEPGAEPAKVAEKPAEKELTQGERLAEARAKIQAGKAGLERDFREVLDAINEIGRDRLDAALISTPGESVFDWMFRLTHKKSKFSGNRKITGTGIQHLSKKGAWTDDPEAEALRKKVLAFIKALKNSAGYQDNWFTDIESAQEATKKPAVKEEKTFDENMDAAKAMAAERLKKVSKEAKKAEDAKKKKDGLKMPSGPGAKQGGAFVPAAFVPRPRVKPNQPFRIITGFKKSGQPIIESTTHGSVQDRSALNTFWRRNFFKEGLLPDEGFMRRIEMEGAMSEVGVIEEFVGHAFKVAIKKHTGVSYSRLPANEKQAINDALAGDSDALSKFAPEIADTIRSMRSHLDQQSTDLIHTLHELIAVRMEMLDNKVLERTVDVINEIYTEGAAGNPIDEIDVSGADPNIVRKAFLVMTIQGNKGEYLNRAYQAFEDKKWGKKIRQNDKVMDEAKAYLRDQVNQQQAARLEKEAKRRVEAATPWKEMIKGPGSLAGKSERRDAMVAAELSIVKAEEQLSPSDIEELVDGHINHILDAAETSTDMIGMLSSDKLGQKDLSILKRRKKIAEPIRALLGEHKDPVYNYTRSASKMAFLIASHNFLMNIRKDGLGVFLSRDKIGKFGTEIMANDPETMTPLTGLYSTKEFAQALEDAVGPKIRSQLIKNMLMANSWVKYGKTVLSPITMMRNFWSASMFTVMNGHFNWAYGGIAGSATMADLAKRGDLDHWQAYIQKLIKKGVLHSGVRAEEMMDAAKEAMDMDKLHSRPAEVAKTVVWKIPTALYRAGDDFWKIIGFENEVHSLMRWRNLSMDDAEVIAAERIRNGYPTYSHVPSMIKAIRRFPLIGPFVSFPWEIIRTTGHQFRFIEEDIKAGAPIAAARRIVGMLVATAAPYAAVSIGMSLAGVDKEEDEAYRFVGPRWQRNSNLLYHRAADGQLWSLDLSHLDPYTYIKSGVHAMLNDNNEGAWKKVSDAVWQTVEPFLGPEITVGAISEVLRNKTIGIGRDVYNEEASTVDQVIDSLDHLRRKLQPGVAAQTENLLKGFKGEVSRGGKEYTVGGEAATFLGFRLTPINAPISLKYRAIEFNQAKRDASRMLSYPLSDPNEVTASKTASAYDKLVTAHNRIYKDMIKAIKATSAMGLKIPQTVQILKAGGVSGKDISYLRRGKVPPWIPTPQFLRGARTMAMATAKDQKGRAEALRKFNSRHIAVMRESAKKRIEAAKNRAESQSSQQ